MTIERTAEQARRRPRDRRERILAAAVERFAEYGSRAASIEDIAGDVGITGGAIYRHFRGKDDLLAEVLARASAGLLAAFTTRRDSSLHELVATTVELAATDRAHLAVLVREHGRDLTGRDAADREGIDRDGTGRDLTGRDMSGCRELAEPWVRALRREGLALDRERAGHRLWIMLAALCEMSASAGGPALRKGARLVTGACVALWRTPALDGGEPAPPPRAWTPPVQRADQVLATATALFRQRGYHDVSMEDIADAVGIVPSGLYRFYPSKASILLDAYDLVVARVLTRIEQVLDTAGGPLEALRGLIELQARAAADSVDLILVTERERHALPEADRPRLARRRRRIFETHVALLREARPDLGPRQARLLLFGLQPLLREAAAAPAAATVPRGEVVALALGLLLGDASIHENDD